MQERAQHPGPSLGSPSLLLVPTSFELERLCGLPTGLALVACAGLGPLAAAARTMQLLLECRPRRVLLAGIGGSFDPRRAPLGSVRGFDEVALDGLGVGEGASRQSASELGFPLYQDAHQTLGERLPLWRVPSATAGGLLLTVHAASAQREQAAERARRFAALVEDMEAFGVAFACALQHVPCACLRAISNEVGVRDKREWHSASALEALLPALVAALSEDWQAPR